MTNKEIVDMLKLLKEQAMKSCNDTAIIDVKKGSFDFVMDSAIKALSQEQQSEWERDHEVLKAYADGQESMKPCKDAISRQAVLDAMCDASIPIVYKGKPSFVVDYVGVIADLPSVSTEKIGHWEEVQFRTIPYNRISKAKKCSVCGKRKDKYVTWNYCPNCGAKMEVEE